MKALLIILLATVVFSPAKIVPPDVHGAALIVALKDIDYDAYRRKGKVYSPEGTAGALEDAKTFKSIIASEHYDITELQNEQATNKRMFDEMRRISHTLQPNDIFVFYYSGHGDEIPDVSGDEKPGKDGKRKDQVYVMFNDTALDDSIQVILTKNFKHTRNVMVVDACHSSSLYKIFIDFPIEILKTGNKTIKNYREESQIVKQDINTSCNYDQTEEIDQPYQLIYFGAAADSMQARGISIGGELTRKMKAIYDEAAVTYSWSNMDYQKYACRIGDIITSEQRLQYHEIGPPKDEFKNTQPFKIEL